MIFVMSAADFRQRKSKEGTSAGIDSINQVAVIFFYADYF